MRKRVNLDELESQDVDIAEAGVRAVGYELRPGKMRPTVWTFEEGGYGPNHRQEEQEELYHVLSGRFEMAFADETMTLDAGDVVVVSPEEERQLRCLDDGEVFVVGAPNVKDDGVVVD